MLLKLPSLWYFVIAATVTKTVSALNELYDGTFPPVGLQLSRGMSYSALSYSAQPQAPAY